MPAKRIKLHHSYTVEDVGVRLGVHKNTVRGWQREGLETIDKARPVMFTGKTLCAYLDGKRKTSKRPCPPGTFYCLKCRTPQSPALGMVDDAPRNALGGNLRALCGVCGTVMNRRAAFASLALKMPGIHVQIKTAPSRIN